MNIKRFTPEQKKAVNEAFEKLDRGEMTFEDVNKVLEEHKVPFRLDPWKNFIGRNEDGAGLMDTGTGTLDKVQVIEDDKGIRLAEPAFDPEAFKAAGSEVPYVMVQYGEVWFTVAEDGVTMLRTKQ